MSALIEVKNLKKYFDTPAGKLHAVDDVSFQIEKGTTIGIVGESGCKNKIWCRPGHPLREKLEPQHF